MTPFTPPPAIPAEAAAVPPTAAATASRIAPTSPSPIPPGVRAGESDAGRPAEDWSVDRAAMRHGYRLLLANAGLFLLAFLNTETQPSDGFVPIILAFVGYLLTQAYGIYLTRGPRRARPLGLLYLANLYVCCYALDLAFEIFSNYPGWWAAASALAVATVAVEPLVHDWSLRWRRAYGFAAGLTMVVCLHQALFFLSTPELYGFGFVGMALLGFGVLLFVPILAGVSLGVHLARFHLRPATRRWFFAGVGLPVLGLLVLATAYLARLAHLNGVITEQSEVPALVRVLEQVDHGFLDEVALLGSASYQSEAANDWGSNRLYHHPLAFWLLLTGEVDVYGYTLDRRQLIQFFEGSSHGLEEQLWRGTEVSTPLVDVRHVVHPATRTVRSRYDLVATAPVSRWGQNEAIYTFHLPPGAAVTNSSLWVNGVEQPGRLTTKARAEAAYRAVVGVERRDPMLVQWRDGQTVSVRVFPIYAELPRAFSVEVVAPLGTTGADHPKGPGRPLLQSVHIEGPGLTWALSAEDVLVDDGDASAGLFLANATETATERPRRRGYHERARVLDDSDWAPSGKTSAFVHHGVHYSLEAAKPVVAAPTPGTLDAPNAVYVDLTAGWTAAALAEVEEAAGTLPVRVHLEGRWRRLGEGLSVEEATAFAKTRPRSFVPIYELPSPRGALLVTRDQTQPFALNTVAAAPTGKRLDDFACDLRPGANLAVFHLGAEAPPYLASLAEVGAVTVERGDLATLTERLLTGERRVNADGPGVVELDGGHRRIVAMPTSLPDSDDSDPALLQLFAARQAMLASQTAELTPAEQERRIDIARVANVVSPFSSLIVLEKDSDYARFGIDNRVGINREAPPTAGAPAVQAPVVDVPEAQVLDQVFQSGQGSVPEPEEWALIALGLLTVCFVVLRRPRA